MLGKLQHYCGVSQRGIPLGVETMTKSLSALMTVACTDTHAPTCCYRHTVGVGQMSSMLYNRRFGILFVFMCLCSPLHALHTPFLTYLRRGISQLTIPHGQVSRARPSLYLISATDTSMNISDLVYPTKACFSWTARMKWQNVQNR
jgi:hypothetical protein